MLLGHQDAVLTGAGFGWSLTGNGAECAQARAQLPALLGLLHHEPQPRDIDVI